MEEDDGMKLAILNLSGQPETIWQPWLREVLPEEADWQVATALEALPAQDRAIVIYDAPDAQFGPAMRAGLPLQQMIDNWQGQARQILDLWRQDRRRLFLIDGAAFAAAPEVLAERLARWLGCPAGQILSGAVGAPDSPDPVGDACSVLSAHAARVLTPVRRLADELEAGGMSPRLARTGIQAQLDAAYALLRGRGETARETETLHGALSDAQREIETYKQAELSAQTLFQEEIELLQHQLTTAQQALEQEYREAITQRDTAAIQMNELHDEVQQMRRAAEQEQLRQAAALAEQARQMAVLLDGHRALMIERGALLGELNRSREEIDALFSSTSWRVTAPLRRARLAVAKPT